MKKPKIKLSLISSMHYIKLFYRASLFILAAVAYVVHRITNPGVLFVNIKDEFWLLAIIWVVYAVEMLLRFFPSKTESMGCQKQFRKNYTPTGEGEPVWHPWRRTAAVIASWLLLNGGIGALYFLGLIDQGILILISLAYGVCDMICILFFCPFQVWMMKNRCCTVCRIYNWDFAMMFTPFIFIPHGYTWSLLFMSLLLLVRWEVAVRRYPERFSECTNASLACKNCKEKLCHHKTRLVDFWKSNKNRFLPK